MSGHIFMGHIPCWQNGKRRETENSYILKGPFILVFGRFVCLVDAYSLGESEMCHLHTHPNTCAPV